mmetsp:Transcript_126729/g.270311  ORF Transcript_126729/g.270311 Transcript_126729/m.270311 type:complete len:235 (+) Transcript_126729:63-767(+)
MQRPPPFVQAAAHAPAAGVRSTPQPQPPRAVQAAPARVASAPATVDSAQKRRASAPPWGTMSAWARPHSEARERHAPSRAPWQAETCSSPGVHFRGTESLASMHLIDQEMPADVRLSQRLGTMASLGDQTIHPRVFKSLPPVSEMINTTSTIASHASGTRSLSHSRGQPSHGASALPTVQEDAQHASLAASGRAAPGRPVASDTGPGRGANQRRPTSRGRAEGGAALRPRGHTG